MATTFSRSKFGLDEPRRTPTNSGELRSRVISEIWFLFFSWLVLTYHKEKHSAWMPKFLPSCYQQGRGQGHTLCSRNPLFPTNHVAREKSHLVSYWIYMNSAWIDIIYIYLPWRTTLLSGWSLRDPHSPPASDAAHRWALLASGSGAGLSPRGQGPSAAERVVSYWRMAISCSIK